MFFGSVQIISRLDSQSKFQMFTLFSDRHAERLSSSFNMAALYPGGGRGGGDSLMKWTGMLVGNFELNPYRRPIWAWSTLLLTSNRDHVRKQTNKHFYISSCATLNETFTATLHTAAEPTIRSAVKILSQRNDTIKAFFFAANKNKNSAQVPLASTSS